MGKHFRGQSCMLSREFGLNFMSLWRTSGVSDSCGWGAGGVAPGGQEFIITLIIITCRNNEHDLQS